MDKAKWISFIFGDNQKTRFKRIVMALLAFGAVLFVLLNLSFGYKDGHWYFGVQSPVKEIKINK